MGAETTESNNIQILEAYDSKRRPMHCFRCFEQGVRCEAGIGFRLVNNRGKETVNPVSIENCDVRTGSIGTLGVELKSGDEDGGVIYVVKE